MHPGIVAARTPNKIAYTMAESGRTVTFAELESSSNQGAQLFRALGLRRGDHIAILLDNHPRFLQICWAAQRSGLFYTAISWRLRSDEVAYIVNNCDAKVFITSQAQSELADALLGKMPSIKHRFMLDGVISGFESWERSMSAMPATPIADQSEGFYMLYSSGTTGYPKGVLRQPPSQPYGTPMTPNRLVDLWGMDQDTVYLSPAPLYHSAPMGFCMGCLREGGQVVVMEHFDPERALACIERYRVTHSQWVPTMFVQMLKLPPQVRSRYDLSSLKYAIHAAAPCPIPVKQEMIEWWGPILYEYYSGTEANGFVHITSAEWLAHPGSVGRPVNCELHIVDEEGNDVPRGERGSVYMAGGPAFEYYKDPEKTTASRNAKGWSTLGDVGYLDEDGYLYLTDRKHFVIISGGVNIYPQEAENVLITHAKVMDVAVFGVPNAEFGEEVKAVVQPRDMKEAGPALAAELIAYCRARLSHMKSPRSIDFRAELPRHPTGKLYKRLLRDEYWREDPSQEDGRKHAS